MRVPTLPGRDECAGPVSPSSVLLMDRIGEDVVISHTGLINCSSFRGLSLRGPPGLEAVGGSCLIRGGR